MKSKNQKKRKVMRLTNPSKNKLNKDEISKQKKKMTGKKKITKKNVRKNQQARMSNQCDMNSQMQVRALVLQNECGRYRIGPCQCDLPRTISRIQPASFLHANAINKSFSLVVVGRYEMMIDIILVAISVFRVSLYILKESLLRNVLCFSQCLFPFYKSS